MRSQIAAGNWKMNTNIDFGQDFVAKLEDKELPKDVEVIIGAPFISISPLKQIAKRIKIAAQNCHDEESGAFTGEVSAAMLKSTGCNYVIIGHSERRQYFNESDELILKKILKALEHELKIIFCCGEPLEIRENNDHESFVQSQLENSICKLSKEELENVVIAYEPIWAIGTGKTASPGQAQDMHQHIRKVMRNNFNEDLAENISILYGGSVKPSNAKEIFAQKDVDGGLVGGASLKIDSFFDIIQSF